MLRNVRLVYTLVFAAKLLAAGGVYQELYQTLMGDDTPVP